VDVLGPLYMMLELENSNAGQFFTPPDIAELMARLTCNDELKALSEPFVTVSEPACGAGGMVLAFVKVMLSYGHWSMSTILTARRQLSWPVEAGNESNWLRG
ncbi:MAG: N-6 DNA methylase, partial [Polaromonas sp.]|nr:N-6 DNA methylase [Polaromonas sp.]